MSPTRQAHRGDLTSETGAPQRQNSKGLIRADKVTKVKKRGWPKGKPRKQQRFPLMKLPLELRCHIYGMALPHQDVPLHSKIWAKSLGTPNTSMNLLLANKEISDEARSVLYGLNRSTVVISAFQIFFQGSIIDSCFRPIPLTPSMPYIKNWQLALWPSRRSPMDSHFRDTVLTVASEIAKIPQLKTLRLAIPCLCEHFKLPPCCYRCYYRYRYRGEQGHCSCGSDIFEDVRDVFVRDLAPLNQLRFSGDVQIVATAKPPQPLEPYRPTMFPSYLGPRTAPGHDDHEGFVKVAQYAHEQCQQPRCLRFVASFEYVRATLMGNTTPLSLTAQQSAWLDVKKGVAKFYPEWNDRLQSALHDLWEALDSGSDVHWRRLLIRFIGLLRHIPSAVAGVNDELQQWREEMRERAEKILWVEGHEWDRMASWKTYTAVGRG